MESKVKDLISSVQQIIKDTFTKDYNRRYKNNNKDSITYKWVLHFNERYHVQNIERSYKTQKEFYKTLDRINIKIIEFVEEYEIPCVVNIYKRSGMGSGHGALPGISIRFNKEDLINE